MPVSVSDLDSVDEENIRHFGPSFSYTSCFSLFFRLLPLLVPLHFHIACVHTCAHVFV